MHHLQVGEEVLPCLHEGSEAGGLRVGLPVLLCPVQEEGGGLGQGLYHMREGRPTRGLGAPAGHSEHLVVTQASIHSYIHM